MLDFGVWVIGERGVLRAALDVCEIVRLFLGGASGVWETKREGCGVGWGGVGMLEGGVRLGEGWVGTRGMGWWEYGASGGWVLRWGYRGEVGVS